MVVQYVGTRYSGWQIQKNRWTVQGKLTETLSELAGRHVTVIGASRTDSRVHAKGQVAHFNFPDKDTIDDLQKTVNALLPWDIRVLQVDRTRPDFHAQKDALKKLYEYQIYNGVVFSPFLHNLALHIRRPLNLRKVNRAAALLIGEHDFTGFAAASTTVQNRVRSIEHSEMTREGSMISYRVIADGFLHHMVRNIIGTLIEIGMEARQPEEVLTPLQARDRSLAGPTAPPEGLYLMKIWY